MIVNPFARSVWPMIYMMSTEPSTTTSHDNVMVLHMNLTSIFFTIVWCSVDLTISPSNVDAKMFQIHLQAHLHKSLIDSEISKLKIEILKSEGVLNLVSSNESHLLDLALAEKLDDLNRIAAVVSRLGKKCSEPALQGFEHVYDDVVSGVIDVKELGFLVRDMEGMVRKMERFVNATANLYGEMEVLNELEQATKKFQHNQHEESKIAFE
ncbi:protein PSK SIMULATOR 1 [Fagus crenata]